LDKPRPTEPWKFAPKKGYRVSYGEAAVPETRDHVVSLVKEVFGD
jgi:hypothetical protein